MPMWAPDVTLTIEPLPRLRMCLIAGIEHATTPATFTASSLLSWDSVISPGIDMSKSPALLTSPSIAPNSETQVPIRSAASLQWLTSATLASAVPPVSRIPAATCSATSASMSLTTTRAPSSAAARAYAAPMPRPAPVTTTDLPSSQVMIACLLM
jgi:hypothetical protein